MTVEEVSRELLKNPLTDGLTLGIRRPSSSTWSTGFICSMVPNRAAAADTRPPRFR